MPLRNSPRFAVAAVALAACTPAPNVPVFSGSVVPTTTDTAGLCVTPATRSAPRINIGTLDVGLRNTYVLHPLLENYGTTAIAVQNIDYEYRRGEPSGPGVYLGGLERGFVAVTAIVVPPASAAGPGIASGDVEIVTPAVAEILRARVCQTQPDRAGCNRPEVRSRDETILVVMRPLGINPRGEQFYDAEFYFQLNVCCGCLVTYAPDADSADVTGPDCTVGTAPAARSCDPGQDVPVDCRVCAGTNPLCQPLNCRAP